jgi:hypothetical protein
VKRFLQELWFWVPVVIVALSVMLAIYLLVEGRISDKARRLGAQTLPAIAQAHAGALRPL